MRNLKYKPKSYRLAEETIKNLEEIAKDNKLSYNMLFTRLINIYNEKNKK